jgi:hypothetical protein
MKLFHPANTGLFRSCLLVATCILATTISATTAPATIDPAAEGVLRATEAKLAAARTVQLTAKHKMSPSIAIGTLDKAPLAITVERPNRFYASQGPVGKGKEIAYDGTTLRLIQPAELLHAEGTVKSSTISGFADAVDAKFGFRPPVAELLSADLLAQMARDATSVRLVGKTRVGWTSCHLIRVEQPGQITELWIGAKDQLPRRYRITFTDLKDQPSWDTRFSKWVLGAPVDTSLFTKAPAAGSMKVQMLKGR